MITEHRNGIRQHDITQMRQNLALVDHCIRRYQQIAAQWDAAGNWDRLSNFRLEEIKVRVHFVTKIRDTLATTVENLDQGPGAQQVSK